jgi:transcriptional regulator with XRE-family HTH domain
MKRKADAIKFLKSLRGKPTTFGGLLRSVRETSDLTQDEMAAKLGVSKRKVSNVERGRDRVSIKQAAEWSKLLGYPPEFLARLAAQEQIDATGVKLLVCWT